ncbi:MAG: sulfur carrier protein ThiS [Acidobacteria bacterium]|nr:sulfur carrier protein ThiS [Acidobacteriota bacterium]MBI3473047.1 sulfur carrier protein ThiS [Candidatus Solibacter usitatus]
MECQPIEITVNGERREIDPGGTILRLLEELRLDPARVAVELDKRIVKRNEWERRQIPPGALIEIVQFVGGG